jgi:hypothetical protein
MRLPFRDEALMRTALCFIVVIVFSTACVSNDGFCSPVPDGGKKIDWSRDQVSVLFVPGVSEMQARQLLERENLQFVSSHLFGQSIEVRYKAPVEGCTNWKYLESKYKEVSLVSVLFMTQP